MTHFLLWLAAVSAPSGVIKQPLTNDTVQNVFNVVLALAGALAVVFIVYSGIKYSLAAGDANSLKEAREGILYALIGLVVVVLSFTLVNYIIGRF